MLLTPPSELAVPSAAPESSPRAVAYIARSCPDRRKTDGFPAPGCAERRIQAERRGIRLTEFDFDERITIVAPGRTSHRL